MAAPAAGRPGDRSALRGPTSGNTATAEDRYGADIDPRTFDADEFARLLAGDAHEVLGGPDGALVLVRGDVADLGPRDRSALAERLTTLAAVIVALVGTEDEAARPPAWCDVALTAEDPLLDHLVDQVSRHPLAATAMAVLLRGAPTSDGVAAGLVAESVTYGLLQAGPEFECWRAGRAVIDRPSTDAPFVLVERDESVLRLTLNRPQVHNAFNAKMRDQLIEGLDVALLDPSVTAVHLDGAGPSFCSGGDLDEFGSRPDPVTAHLVRLTRNVGRTIAAIADRVTVHLHGAAFGAGIELAAFADHVVAAADTRMALPEIGLGLIPGAGGTVSLPRRIGRHRTALLALSAQAIDAPTALAWGLVDEVSPPAG